MAVLTDDERFQEIVDNEATGLHKIVGVLLKYNEDHPGIPGDRENRVRFADEHVSKIWRNQ